MELTCIKQSTIEFKVGTSLLPEELIGATNKVKKEVWVRGVAYALALHVRKFNKAEHRKGYLFHTGFGDGDGDTVGYSFVFVWAVPREA